MCEKLIQQTERLHETHHFHQQPTHTSCTDLILHLHIPRYLCNTSCDFTHYIVSKLDTLLPSQKKLHESATNGWVFLDVCMRLFNVAEQSTGWFVEITESLHKPTYRTRMSNRFCECCCMGCMAYNKVGRTIRYVLEYKPTPWLRSRSVTIGGHFLCGVIETQCLNLSWTCRDIDFKHAWQN